LSKRVDDIEDHTEVRRGQPGKYRWEILSFADVLSFSEAAHVKFGEPLTINAANYVYFQALNKCLNLGNEKAMRIFSEEMIHLHQGQGLDIYWRDSYVCPTLEQYKYMVSCSKLKSFECCRLTFD
jgi:geranylgeranyl diphosphate synthase type 3